jgi:phenylalanyl-tRNA synthetase beta chain
MKFSEKWLREWVNPDIDTDTLVEQLTIAGLEVDGVESAAGEFTDVVVAEVVSVESHPDADKLSVCQVNDGSGETVQVVCGASNVYAGMRAPFARVKAELPGGFKIKKARLRGVESFGMLCSEQELGLAETADGLMDLPPDAPAGKPVREYLGLDDMLIELDLTPNRGDCLSIMGIAREVAAINEVTINAVKTSPVNPVIDDRLPVVLDAPGDCPVYCGRVIRGINQQAVTPLWMQEKLRRSGVRPISPVVDVTNYVLLELGQPMHAFDINKLDNEVHVRRATAGEQLTLLDGKEITLDEEVLVIADNSRALAMAGIMGGADSAVDEETRDIFLESAFFNPLTIAGRARQYGLHTDSSHRFERGVDPQLQAKAIERATELLLDIVGGQAGPVITAVDEAKLPEAVEIMLRKERVNRVLGVELSDELIESMLTRLGISMSGADGQWQVRPPSYRFDLTIEADLIEELARLYGYNNIPQTQPQVPQYMTAREENRLELDAFKDVLVQRGWQEAVTYSFVDPTVQAKLSPERRAVELSNPLSTEMSQMRTSHWTGLIQALQYNQNRQQQQVRLFETGLNFIGSIDELEQDTWISGVSAGPYWPERWDSANRAIDFYDTKGDLEALISLTRSPELIEYKAEKHPALHPGQTARIYCKNEPIGWLGSLHPTLEKAFDLEGPVYLFELNIEALLQASPRRFEPISKYPAIRRDLALVVDEDVDAEQILKKIKAYAPEIIQKAVIFDIYRGKGIETKRKSIALGLILQDYSRTLTDEDVEEVISGVVMDLKTSLGAALRE